MDRLRLASFSKGDNLTRRSMSHVPTGPPTVPEAPSEIGHNIQQVPRCVIVQRDERGYGLTVLGDNPVFVQDVIPGGAAARAGVQEGDRILKVNGTLVTSANHQEVVQMIRSGQYVALTLIGPSPGQHPPTQQRPLQPLHRGTSFIQGSLTPNQTKSTKRDDGRTDHITAPQPVDADIMAQCNSTTLQTVQRMLSASLRQKEELELKIAADSPPDPILRSDYENVLRTIDSLRKQMLKFAATPPAGSGSREATPDSLAKQPPRRTKSGSQAKMANSASMENITSSSGTPPSLSSLSTPPRGHLLGNHQRQRSSPDSLIYRSPNEETAQWPTSPVSDVLAKPPTGESADVGGAPNEAFEFDDDDSSPLLQQQQHSGITKPMANRPLPPLPSAHAGQDICGESRGSFDHQDSTESDAGVCLLVDQTPSAYDEGGAVNLGESLLKGWKMLRQPIEVAMFLHYLLQNNINPAPFLFFVIVEQYKSGKPQDMCKWAYEITSTFLAPNAPLCIDPSLEDDVLQTIDSYMRLVDDNLQINETELRDIFGRARMTATSFLKPQIEEFQREIESKTVDYSQSMIDASGSDSATDILKNWETILLNLCRTLLPLQDQVDSLPNQKSAMLSAIATVLKLTVVKSEAGLKALEHIPTFVSKEKFRLKLFPQRSKKAVLMSTLGHSFQGQHYNRVTHCSVCQDILWGVGDQGLQCSNCEMNIHKQCFKSVDETCVGEGTRAKKPARRPTNMFRSHDNDSATDLDKLSGGAGGSPLSANKPVVRSESFRQRRENRNSYRKRSDPNIPRSKSDVADDRPNVGKTAYSDSDMDCEDELPKWADLVDFETVRLMKPKEKKRQEVLNELFHTERLHVRKLKILNTVYYKPLIKLLDQSLLDKLFPNLQELINIHSDLNVKMKTKRKAEPVIGNVGKIMLDFFTGEGGSNLEMAIATFCKDQTTALEELKAKQKKDPKLQQFLAEASMKKECAKLHLKEIIATSHQRLTKYPMLLDQILKYTQPGEEYDQIFSARENSKRILAKVNRTIGEIANQNRVREVEKHLEVWPPKEKDAINESRVKEEKRTDGEGGSKKKPQKHAEPHVVHPLFSDPTLSKHKLIHEGVLEWKLTKMKTIDINAMLFDDFLVLLHKQDDKYLLRYHQIYLSDDKRVTYPPVIDVPRQNYKDAIAIRDVATNKLGFFLVTLKQNSMYEFVAKSVSDKNKWLDKIQNLEKYVKEEDLETPLIMPPSSASAAEEPKDASKPIIRRPEEDRVYQILKEDPLLEFKAAVTVEPPVTQSLETAQQVATLPAQLQKIDEEIFRLLNEKYIRVAEMMGLPSEQTLLEISEKRNSHDEHTARDPLGLIVDVMSSTRELQTLISESLKAPAATVTETSDASPPDNQRMFPGMCCANAPHKPSIPAHEALSICRRLNASCVALSQVVGMFDTKGILASTNETDSIAGHVDPLTSAIDNVSLVDNSDADPLYVNLSPNNNPEDVDFVIAEDDSNNNAAVAEVPE